MNEDEPHLLNEHHKRRLLVSCEHIDRLLSDVEQMLTAESGRGAVG